MLETDHSYPADDETDMKALEEAVRSIEKDGLVWGASKRVPVGYGVSKLQISLVVEDEKISLDELQEEIAGFEDYVQSSDIVSSLPKNVCVNPWLTMSTPGYYAKAVNCLYEQGLSVRTGMRSLHAV
jgi:translation elongation factor EF-1beta